MKTFKEGFGQKGINLHVLNHPLPSHLGVQNEVIPKVVFNLKLMPLFLVAHVIIMLNLNNPKSDVMEKVSNLNFPGEPLRNSLPKRVCFEWKWSKLLVWTPHNSCMMQVAHCQVLWTWMQSQILCLTDSLMLGRKKTHCLERDVGAIHDCDNLVSNRPHEGIFFARKC